MTTSRTVFVCAFELLLMAQIVLFFAASAVYEDINTLSVCFASFATFMFTLWFCAVPLPQLILKYLFIEVVNDDDDNEEGSN